MIVGVIVSAIAGGLAGLMVSIWHGLGWGYALLFYTLGGVVAVVGYVAVRLSRDHNKRV